MNATRLTQLKQFLALGALVLLSQSLDLPKFPAIQAPMLIPTMSLVDPCTCRQTNKIHGTPQANRWMPTKTKGKWLVAYKNQRKMAGCLQKPEDNGGLPTKVPRNMASSLQLAWALKGHRSSKMVRSLKRIEPCGLKQRIGTAHAGTAAQLVHQRPAGGGGVETRAAKTAYLSHAA